MNTTPNWALACEYKTSVKKDDLISMALSLHHAWTEERAASRVIEMALIEARATVKAQAMKIEDDAHILRKSIAAQKRLTHDAHEFTLAEMTDASTRYCELHGVRSVGREALKDAMRKGEI